MSAQALALACGHYHEGPAVFLADGHRPETVWCAECQRLVTFVADYEAAMTCSRCGEYGDGCDCP